MSSLHPAIGDTGDTGDTAQPTRRPTQAQSGDHVNPLTDSPTATDQITGQITGPCLCHDAADCPDQATLTISARELARVGQLLSEVDEFLRSGTGVAGLLADFYLDRGDPQPRFTANNLIDAVGFAALTVRRRFAEGGRMGGR